MDKYTNGGKQRHKSAKIDDYGKKTGVLNQFIISSWYQKKRSNRKSGEP